VNGDGLTAEMALVPLFCDAVEFIRTSKEGAADSLAFLRSRPSATAAFRRASLDRFAIPNFYADKSLTRRLLVQFRADMSRIFKKYPSQFSYARSKQVERTSPAA
jgi:hypothetical protein